MTGKMTVKELIHELKQAPPDYTVELSVNYDSCRHMQELSGIWIPEKESSIDWIVLEGVKER